MADAPKRILLVEENEDGTTGGSHVALVNLVRGLDRARFEPLVVFYQDNPHAAVLRAMGVPVETWETLRARERHAYGAGRRLAQLSALVHGIRHRAAFLARERIDLVHLNNSPWQSVEFWLPAARRRRVPLVAHARADLGWLAPDAPGGHQLLARARRRLSARLDRIMPVSASVLASLRAGGLPDARLTLVHDGIDTAGVRAAAMAPSELPPRPAGARVILMAGNLKPWKGQHVLLEAIAEMPEASRAGLEVWFAGAAAPEEAEYQEHLRVLATQVAPARATLLGSRRDVPALMRAADVVVHASTIAEPFGLVVVEAMALGRPVIASRLGGPGEIVTEGSGLLFDPARPGELAALLKRLLEDDAERARLGTGAIARSEAFSAGTTTAQVQRVYREVLPAADRS